MKKFLTVLVLALGISAAAYAQPRAIGIRATGGCELSYQHSLGSNFLEADLGWWTSKVFALKGTYNFLLTSPTWTEGTWNVYGGPCVGLIAGDGVAFTAGGMIGLEYTFASIPLQLSVDIRPDILSISGNGLNFFGYWTPGLGIRYAF